MTIQTRIEWAYGADLTASPAGWAWTDESLYALGGVELHYGSQDEASQTQPTWAKFRMKNIDSRFSPRHPLGVNYPDVRLQTPIRISQNPGTGYTQRAVLYVTSITPVWPSGNSDYAEVEVIAAGITQRSGQGHDAPHSAMYRAYVQSNPVAYWSLEDLAGSVRAESPLSGVLPMYVLPGTKPIFGAASGPAGSAQVPSFSQNGVGGSLVGSVSSAGSPTSWRVEFSALFAAFLPATFNAVVQWLTLGTIRTWEIDASQLSDGGLFLQYITAAGAFGGPFLSNVRVDDNQWHHIRVDGSQSGGNIAFTVKLDGNTVISTSAATSTIGAVQQVIVNPTAVADESAPAVGHLAVWAPFSSSVDTLAAFNANVGETAGARIVRVAAEEGIPASVSSTAGTAIMGPQGVAAPLDTFRDCETVDGGLLYDGGTGGGITYLAAQDRMSLPVTMALDTNRQQVKLPFSPTEDDQRKRNRWTIARLSGAQQTYTDTEHVAANNGLVYADSSTLNVAADTQLRDEAGWRTNHGTVEEMRVPGLSLQLIDHPELWAPWLAMTLGKRMTATNLPAQYPPGTLDMALLGAVETWNAASWIVEANTGPYQPWRVAVFAADASDTGEFVGRFDTAGSTMVAAATSTATTALVRTTSGPLWTMTLDDFPLDVGVSGQQNRVGTAAAVGIASPVLDTFGRSASSSWGAEPISGVTYTVSPSGDHNVAAGVGTQTHNSVNALRTALLDLGTGVTDVDVTADVSLPVTSAAGASITQWLGGRSGGASDYYAARLDLTTAGAVSLGLYKRVAGVLTNLVAQATIGTGHVSGDVWRIYLQVTGTTIQASAWIPASGSQPLQFQVSTTDSSLTAGTQIVVLSRLESGNTNPLNVVVSWDNVTVLNPQKFTFSQRGVNGVTKALTSGQAVSLWTPPVFAK